MEARSHLRVILGSGAVVGLLLGLSTMVVTRWGHRWFAISLSVVLGVIMVCYVAVPSRLIGLKSTTSTRDKLTASAVGGALGSGPFPAIADERLHGRKTTTVTEPQPDEYELYDLTVDPTEEHNLPHPSHADERSRALQQTMLGLLNEQLAAKRLTPSAGERPGYRPPVSD